MEAKTGSRMCRSFGVLSSLLFVFSVLAQPISADDDEHHAKVLILGAGASGLEAAKRFHESGMDDFLIIEGANYIGGRVHDVPFGELQVELGANWAYPAGTSIVDEVLRLGIETHPSDWDNLILRNATGYDVTEEADPNWERLEEAMDTVYEIGRDILENNKADMSQRTALSLGGWVPETPLDDIIEWLEYDFEYADLPSVTSLKSTVVIPYSPNNSLLVIDQRGFDYLFHEIIEFLEEDTFDNRVHLNQTVVSIDQSSDVIVVTSEDGTCFTGDYILVTFSLGVLQAGTVEFIPPLPDWKIGALFKFNMVSYTKIFLKFPSKFWDDEEWIMHASERRGYYPVFLNFEADGMFPRGTNILNAHVVGEESRRIERQSDAEVKAEIMQVLRDLYGEGVVPEVEEILVSRWNHNPLVNGAYSNWPVEFPQDCFPKIQSRFERVFFAGEHSDPVMNGFVLGAQISGEREADKIMECITEDMCPDPVYPGNGATNIASRLLMSMLVTIMTMLLLL